MTEFRPVFGQPFGTPRLAKTGQSLRISSPFGILAGLEWDL
ncbi:hypothetical protein ACO2Q8_09485 [Larkinella sp. VNQ87]